MIILKIYIVSAIIVLILTMLGKAYGKWDDDTCKGGIISAFVPIWNMGIILMFVAGAFSAIFMGNKKSN